MRIQKPDRLVGYVLLIIGIIMILIPVIMSTLIVVGTISFPIYVRTPTVSGTDAELAGVLADAFPLFNVIPTFLLFVVLVYAGSVLMGEGVGLIKEINFKVVTSPEKSVEPEEAAAPEPKKPTKKARTATQET